MAMILSGPPECDRFLRYAPATLSVFSFSEGDWALLSPDSVRLIDVFPAQE